MSYHPYSLRDFLAMSVDNFSEDHYLVLVYNLLCSIKYLHSLNLLHRDIKPSNILIDSNCTVKICDFGWTRTYSQEYCYQEVDGRKKRQRALTPSCFTRHYRPPEIILCHKKYSSYADCWSLGCTLSQLALKLNSKESVSMKEFMMFPGVSCYPMSPHVGLAIESQSMFAEVHQKDQLLVILKCLGKQSEGALSFIDAPEYSHQYIHALNHSQVEGNKLNQLLEGNSPAMIKLISELLLFNPNDRHSAGKSLENPIFDEIRRTNLEKAPGY